MERTRGREKRERERRAGKRMRERMVGEQRRVSESVETDKEETGA